MSRPIRLRPWQRAALEAFESSAERDFLAVATPGAGKTTFALTAALRQMATDGGPKRLLVVAPTAHLKDQWARAATAFGLHLDPSWSAADGGLPRDMHGIVTTYQQVASSAAELARPARDAMVVFDEIHHAGEERSWGESVLAAFGQARRRLSLSGTPFRSDTRSIPFLRYELDEARPDYEYGYGDALQDRRVVRPVYFPRTNGHMEWSAPDGSVHEATFEDPLNRVLSNQRLRTALSLEGEWLPTVLREANHRLGEIRHTHPQAGGLVIATDQDHAKGIATLLRDRFGVRATVATSDDSDASRRISEFASSDQPWLVAVRMVSEGVDIPRLRVGVFATTTTTELFFRQAVGRLVRWTSGVPRQRAYLYIPDDARLRARAFQIAEVRRHCLRKDAKAEEQDPAQLDEVADLVSDDQDQPSLFSVISAVATDTETHDHDDAIGHDEVLPEFEDPAADEGLMLDLPALELSAFNADGEVFSRKDLKRKLREANAELAKALARKTGWSHAQVNRELNRLAGIDRVTTATVAQLEKRKLKAEKWYSGSSR